MKLDRVYEKIIIIFIVLMPLHSLLFDTIIVGKFDNMWRDFLLLISIIFVLYAKNGKIKIGRYGGIIIFVSVWILIFTFLSDRFGFALNLARTYIIPMLIYFFVININFSEASLKKIENIFVCMGCVLAVYGIFQAFVLGDSFLVKLGYPSTNGHLRSNGFYISGFYGIQRVNSTFVYPNVCGIYFGIVLLLLSLKLNERKIYKVFFAIVLTGLVTTFSRSAILGTIIGMIILHRKKLLRFRINGKYILYLMLFVTMGFLLDRIILDGRVINMIQSSIMSTLNITDSSAAKHLQDLVEPLLIIFHNPFGLGFGHNGPNVLSMYGKANLVESSIYLLAYDFGWIGAIVYVLPYISEVIKCRGNSDMKSISGAVCALVLFTYILLPNVQNYEVIFFVYLFIGIYSRKEN